MFDYISRICVMRRIVNDKLTSDGDGKVRAETLR